MVKICRGCGELFKATNGNQSYCNADCQAIYGKSNRAKPAGWVFHGECPQCGKHFESDRKKKYCSDECQCQFQLDRAKAERLKAKPLCQQCGKQLPLKRTTFCSDACQKLSEKKTDIVWAPLTDEIIRQRIAEHYDNIEHISGHKSDGKLTVRCKVCGGVFQMGERVTRKGNTDRTFPCPCCANAQKTEKAIEKTTHLCEVCGQALLGRRAGVKYCSDICSKVAAAHQYHEKRVCERKCRYCGNVFIPKLKGMWAYCSEDCFAKQKADLRKQHKHIRRAKKWNNGDVDYGISLTKLIKRDKNICHICGLRCDKGDYTTDANGNYIIGGKHPSIDHVMPLANGGTHTWDNVKLAHCMCNSLKSNNTCYERSNGQMALAI